MATDSEKSSQITVFWSWQSDSPPKENRNFIENCLKKAAKKIFREDAIIVDVDRDTKGTGGSPKVAETIFAKILASDIFVWDATLVYSDPRPSPNPNVLIEFGYALAVLGEGRIIGVMNIDGKPGGDALPFDLKDRRWPITYSGTAPSDRDELINTFTEALKNALKEPKQGAFFSDVDFQIAKNLWSIIPSKWLTYWYGWRMDHPQNEKKSDRDIILNYLYTIELPEFIFTNETLQKKHLEFIEALSDYALTAAKEMAPDGPCAFVINTKAAHTWQKNYDERYERECKMIIEKINLVWAAWNQYLAELRLKYPEIVFSSGE